MVSTDQFCSHFAFLGLFDSNIKRLGQISGLQHSSSQVGGTWGGSNPRRCTRSPLSPSRFRKVLLPWPPFSLGPLDRHYLNLTPVSRTHRRQCCPRPGPPSPLPGSACVPEPSWSPGTSSQVQGSPWRGHSQSPVC